MAATHGTQRRYVEGCRCQECKDAHRAAARDYRERRANGEVGAHRLVSSYFTGGEVTQPAVSGPGPVEQAVTVEVSGLVMAELRPGLVEVALSLARILDNPRSVNQQPAAAGSWQTSWTGCIRVRRLVGVV